MTPGFQFNDGGRVAAGITGSDGDCVARADSWQHVLQIETDSEVGPWIGEGCLYVCIRKSDLAERRFDRMTSRRGINCAWPALLRV